MGEDTPYDANGHRNDESGASNSSQSDKESMPPKDREDMILQFFVDHGFPLPPKALYRALKVSENITFAYRTTQNILQRLLEEGYVMRLDKDKLDNGVIEPLPEGEEGRRTYYYITEKGRRRLESE